MNAKSFVLGVVVGMAGFALVDRVIQPVFGPQTAAADSSADSPDRQQPLNGTTAGSSHRDDSSGARQRARAADSPSSLPDPVLQPVTAHVAEPETVSAEASSAAAQAGEADWPPQFIGSDPRTGAARAAEAKDVAWSYQMEQLLTQFLATHPPAAHFDLRSIDCRTTFCQIRAVSSHPDAYPIWTQISHDISKQAWNEFGPSGTSLSKTTTGNAALIMFLARNSRSR